jgi:chitinase
LLTWRFSSGNRQSARSPGVRHALSDRCVHKVTPSRYLFPTPGPKSNTEKLDIKLDTTIGSGSSNSKYAANDHAFGWYIMSGPEDEFSTVAKRDGSHWELFDCSSTAGEERQTVKAVCTDASENSNCHHIFKGGVEATVVEMPGDCGPGRYAVAWAMQPSTDHDHIRHHLEKRGLSDSAVFDFTFDYDFTHFEKRADSNVLLRIDYSDDPGYWQSIVAEKPGKTSKRQIEVDTQFGGDHKAWLEHNWHVEKRALGHEEIHKRWFSGDVKEWWDRQRNVDVKYDGVRHNIKVSTALPALHFPFRLYKYPGHPHSQTHRTGPKLPRIRLGRRAVLQIMGRARSGHQSGWRRDRDRQAR